MVNHVGVNKPSDVTKAEMLCGCLIQAKPPMYVSQAFSDRISPCCTAPAQTFGEAQ